MPRQKQGRKLPSMQWYPGDWLKDPAVRSVSYAARGLWTDMLCLMHEGDRRGYLQLNGSPVSPDQLARMTGGSAEEVTRLLRELDNSGVFSCTEHGIIYSRRMVRDERKRALCAEAGSKGGNPNLRPRKENPETLNRDPKGGVKGRPKGGLTPSSSTSVSTPPSPPGGEWEGGGSGGMPGYLAADLASPNLVGVAPRGGGRDHVLAEHSPAFRAVWDAYPAGLRGGTGPAWREWQALSAQRPGGEARLQADCLRAIEAQRSSERWREGRVPGLAKFIADGVFEDVPDGSRTKPSSGGRVVPDADESRAQLAALRREKESDGNR